MGKLSAHNAPEWTMAKRGRRLDETQAEFEGVVPFPFAGGLELSDAVEQSQDVLIDMLKERFERAVDLLLEHMAGSETNREARLGALFALYEEGVLTKGEVRRRGELSPETFYDELRAYRLHSA